MTSTEAMIYQLKRLKGKPLKVKVVHIATYYWLPIVIVLTIAIAAGSYIVHLVTMKDMALGVICLNAYSDSDTTNKFIVDFAEKKEIDLKEYDVVFSTKLTLNEDDLSIAYNTSQVIAARVADHSVDLLTGDLETITRYFYQDIFLDLNQVMTEEQKTRYAAHFLYVDMSVMRRFQDGFVSSIQFPNPMKPEEMEEPVPVALWLSSGNNFSSTFYPHSKDCVVVGVIATSENLVNALAFLDYVMQ